MGGRGGGGILLTTNSIEHSQFTPRDLPLVPHVTRNHFAIPFKNAGYEGGSGGYQGGRSGGGPGVCYSFQKGECSRGSGCRFSHEGAGGGYMRSNLNSYNGVSIRRFVTEIRTRRSTGL